MDVKIPDTIVIPYNGEIINLNKWSIRLPVDICGVKNGVITENGDGSEDFKNIGEAKKVFLL